MKIAIDISEETYKATCNGYMLQPDVDNVINAIKNGTPLDESECRECCDVCLYSDEGQASPSVRMMGCKRRVSYEIKKGYERGFMEGQKNPLFGEKVKKLIFKKGDEIKYIYSEDKFVVLYVDDVNDLMYVMDSEGHIDTIDIFDADKYGLTGARYRIELTPDISLVSDKKESIDILKMEIHKINYELDRIVKELHALNKKK